MTQSQWSDNINPLKLADYGDELRGEVPVTNLPRLMDLLSDSSKGEVAFLLTFGVNDERERYVRGRIDAELSLTCQRCGDPVVCTLRLEPNLCPVLSDEQAKHLPKDVDPLLVGETGVSLLELLEEELLLGLPLVAKHDTGACTGPVPECLH